VFNINCKLLSKILSANVDKFHMATYYRACRSLLSKRFETPVRGHVPWLLLHTTRWVYQLQLAVFYFLLKEQSRFIYRYRLH